MVYRAVYTSDDEYDEICTGKLLFAPKRLLLSGSSLTAAVATWRRSSHLRPRSYRRPSNISYCYWFILLTGDVETNPVPVKFPCTRCGKVVKQNDHAICCDRCENWSHAACCGISHTQYQYHASLGDSKEWLCHTCTATDFPFANASTISESLSRSLTFSQHLTLPPKRS